MRTRDTIRTLNSLIRTCRDAEYLCQISARAVVSEDLRALVSRRSEEWARQGDELQALVLLLGGSPDNAGSAAGYVLGSWASARSAVLGRSDLSAVEDWNHVQERALDKYQHALLGYLPERIRRTVGLQADRMIERLEQINALCGQYALDAQGISPM
jgi:uncharacterized protein (TIGR02284 family)